NPRRDTRRAAARALRLRPGWSMSSVVPERDVAAVELVEVLHAVLHRTLVRAGLVHPAREQRGAPGVHPAGNLVVLDAGFHIGGALGLDEVGLEQGDLLRIVELDDVRRA